jgi:hypothetical protein
MLQAASSAGLTTESGAGSLIFNEQTIKNLDRDGAINQQVTRTVNRAHTTDAQAIFELVFFVEYQTYKRIGWSVDHGGIGL